MMERNGSASRERHGIKGIGNTHDGNDNDEADGGIDDGAAKPASQTMRARRRPLARSNVKNAA